ncbi:MAG: Mce-associated rane protein [Nocardioidaceae bacterium]|jgi:Mce-associated membrane protein|nr:Mce-associated rane protein [Nocardioidaceae bacterium]
MAKLKRDERVCPFCAETIKASAIRCRFCHSDVTPVVEPEAQPTPTAEAKPTTEAKTKAKTVVRAEPEPAAVEESEDAEEGAGRTPLYKRLTLVLAVLVALAGAGVGTLWWRAGHGTETAAPNGTLVADDARTEVLVSAADLAQRTLSYDYKSLANDMEVARARMTPGFRKQYDATMAQVRANTTKNKIVLEAVAVSSAIISATEHKAKVLVFLNQTTTAGTGKKANQQASRNSLVINLTRGDGDWAISKLTSLG